MKTDKTTWRSLEHQHTIQNEPQRHEALANQLPSMRELQPSGECVIVKLEIILSKDVGGTILPEKVQSRGKNKA